MVNNLLALIYLLSTQPLFAARNGDARCKFLRGYVDCLSIICAINDKFDAELERLVFADWLQEHKYGERAEFIREHIQFSKMSKKDPEYVKTRARLIEILKRNLVQWLSVETRRAIRTMVDESRIDDFSYLIRGHRQDADYERALLSFDRGFLTKLWVGPSDFSQLDKIVKSNMMHLNVAAEADLEGLASLTTTRAAQYIDELYLSRLTIVGSRFTADSLRSIGSSPDFAKLRRLEMGTGEIFATSTRETGFWSLFSDSASTKNIEEVFWTVENSIEPFTAAQPLTGLKLKKLRSAIETDDELRNLIASGILKKIEELNAAHTQKTGRGISNFGVRTLLTHALKLKSLTVKSDLINDNVSSSFIGLENAELEEVKFSGGNFTPDGLADILEATLNFENFKTISFYSPSLLTLIRNGSISSGRLGETIRRWKSKMKNRRITIVFYEF